MVLVRFHLFCWPKSYVVHECLLAAADVECIAHTLDFDALQDNIANVAFCDIEQELVCTQQQQSDQCL